MQPSVGSESMRPSAYSSGAITEMCAFLGIKVVKSQLNLFSNVVDDDSSTGFLRSTREKMNDHLCSFCIFRNRTSGHVDRNVCVRATGR